MKEKNFGAANWRDYIPTPVYDENKNYVDFYNRAWEIAFDHVKDIPGMAQNPYMDEAFCATQIWIWDTCFMSLFCKYGREAFPGVESLNNFYSVLHEGGHLATVMPPEDEPNWTGAKFGEPYEIKVHIADNPPLFAWAEYENALFLGDKEYIKDLLCNRQVLQKHYDWLENLKKPTKMQGVMAKPCWSAQELGYKWEGGRSGMDNTPRGRVGEHAVSDRPNNRNMLWIDAICEQALSAKMIAKLYNLIGDTAGESEWTEKFEGKAKIVNDYYWDEEDKFYYDIDCVTKEPIKVMSIASAWALASGIATKERAKEMVMHLENEKELGGCIPFVSVSRSDNDYNPTGRYWRGSVWMPTAYAALKGYQEYGYLKEARKASEKIIEHMYRTYTDYEPHTIWESYNPEKFEPSSYIKSDEEVVRKDFCGWSALGPIAAFIEYVIGFYKVDAFENKVKWHKPESTEKAIGIKNLRFGDIITDIVAEKGICKVVSNAPYTLEIDGKDYEISAGETVIEL